MRKYKTLAMVSINGGHIQLTESQAAARMHCLERLENDIYKVNKKIEFKKGETFGYDGEIPKSKADCFEQVSNDESEAAEPEAAQSIENDESEAIEDVINAIELLDEDDESNWLGDGKPRVEALETLVGRDISATERDIAWKMVQGK